MKKLMIIDGNSLAHRAFHALPLLTNTSGQFTNAVLGFTTMLQKVMRQEQPDYLAVAFDKSKVTFRNEEYAGYKAHRKSTPDEMRPQFPLIKRVLKAYRIPILEQEGFEGDDLIGTLARRAEERGLQVLVVTSDRDLLQLVSGRVHALLTRKGISEMDLYTPADVEEKFGVSPEQVADLKGLKGDSSDEIPGVPGIGPKTAMKLLQECGNLEQCLEQTDRLPKRVRALLEQYRDQALLSKRLATIRTDVPIEVDFEQLIVEPPDYGQLVQIFQELEFRSLLRGLQEEIPAAKKQGRLDFGEVECPPTQQNRIITNPEDGRIISDLIRSRGRVALSFERSGATPLKAPLVSLGLAWSERDSAIIEFSGEEEQRRRMIETVLPLLTDPTVEKWCHDAKSELELAEHHLAPLQGIAGDTMLGAYLLNPATASPTLEEISLKYCRLAASFPTEEQDTPARRALAIYRSWPVIKKQLEEDELFELFRDLELPLSSVLAEMERNGVAVDQQQLDLMSVEMGRHLDQLTKEIYALAGEPFNINSPKQLGTILFEKLKLPVIKKTKTGYSTNAAVLEALAPYHDIAAKLSDYRIVMKLKSTYVDGLRGLIDPVTGKVHTTFNQTITATGRLSSTEPNLQNIPIRLELGRKIRRAFVPSEPGWVILAADYSQIELRILAHISGDERLIESFRKGEDIHRSTAAAVFGVPPEEVTAEMRRRAKGVNFGIIYGITDYGLARDIGVSRQDAAVYIDNYFRLHPGVDRYLKGIIVSAKAKGYVRTIMKRRRFLPDILSSNRNVRSFGERTAMNTPIQGSAADIIKLAMLRVDKTMREAGVRARMLLQVHDELIFELPPDELPVMRRIIKDGMENVIELKVPLAVSLETGPNWYDLEPLEGD